MSHDQFIESGRERLNKRLQERKIAAKAAREDAGRNQACEILTRQDEVERTLVYYLL